MKKNDVMVVNEKALEGLEKFKQQYFDLQAKAIKSATGFSFDVGKILHNIEVSNLLKDAGFSSVTEYASKELGVSKSTASTAKRVYERFAIGQARTKYQDLPYKLLATAVTFEDNEKLEEIFNIYRTGKSATECVKLIQDAKATPKQIAKKQEKEQKIKEDKEKAQAIEKAVNESYEKAYDTTSYSEISKVVVVECDITKKDGIIGGIQKVAEEYAYTCARDDVKVELHYCIGKGLSYVDAIGKLKAIKARANLKASSLEDSKED